MADSWNGSNSTDWFTSKNWSNGVPTNTATGTQHVVISGTSSHQPVISPNASNAQDIWVAQTLNTAGANYSLLEETQIGGQAITLTNGADLTLQGVAMGVFYGNTDTLTPSVPQWWMQYGFGSTMSGLHGALSTTPSYDSHMQLIAHGSDTLSVDTVNENFGLITIGSGDTLSIDNNIGGNAQALHGLINYGLITVAAGGELIINAQTVSGQAGTVANFYNAGWIEVDGGTLNMAASVLDGANTASTAGSVDGYIEISHSGTAILNNTVATHEQITFADSTANTLQLTAGTLFSGTVNNFGATDTILVNGFTSTSNATLTTVGGKTELLTTNGSVVTTITLSGTVSTAITTGTNSAGQEYIQNGATSFASGSNNLGNAGSSAVVTNSSAVSLTGTGTTLTAYDSIAGTGAYTIDNGATLVLANSTGNDAGQSIVFGTHGSAAAPNTLIINDNSAGFGGAISGFGANDAIDIGGSVLPALTGAEGVALNYQAGVLTVAETNASGATLNSTALSISGTAALSTSSFVAMIGPNGIEIETASSKNGDPYTFSTTGTGSFESAANYNGGTAPGDIIAPGETVVIQAGTASVSSGGVTDNGTLSVNSAFIDPGSITGTGTLDIAAGAAATLSGGTSLASIIDAGSLTASGSVNSTIDMQGNGAGSVADLVSGDVSSGTLQTSLTNFGTSDTLVLGSGNFSLNGAADHLATSYNSATGQLTVTDTTNGASLALGLTLASGDQPSFIQALDQNGVLELTLCFYPGTRIATPAGEVDVEALRPGDIVLTESGPKPVRWIGQSHIATCFADPLRSLPIRIRQGALGQGLPTRDLLLSPDHAIFLDGILVQASALVNGGSIVREHDVPEHFTYYHVELETHELLHAEGVLAESFVDNVDRMHFHNWEERTAPQTPIAEMPYPRAKSHRQLPTSIRRMLGMARVA